MTTDDGRETVVMLPGMMCDSRLFMPQITALGRSHEIMFAPLSKADNFADMTAELLSVAPPSFALCGLSMGGIWAMEVMRQAPERVTRLALLDTNPLAETDQGRPRRGRQIKDVLSGHLRKIVSEEMKPLYLADGPNKKEILNLCMDMAMDCGPDVFVSQSLALRDRRDQTDTLRQVSCPCLILCGEQDSLCPVERHEMMAGLIPHASFEKISGAGHLPPLEQPEQTTKALASWLATAS